jgi:hypothetical protein
MKKLILLLLVSISFSTYANWKLEKKVNDFEETTIYFLMSDKVEPNKPLSWPNNNAYAYMYYQCGNIYTLVLSASQFAKKTIGNSFDFVSFNAKVEGVEIETTRSFFGLDELEIWNVSGKQDWGSDHIRIEHRYGEKLKFADASKITFQINHYVDGKRIYEFDMNGFDISLCDVDN